MRARGPRGTAIDAAIVVQYGRSDHDRTARRVSGGLPAAALDGPAGQRGIN